MKAHLVFLITATLSVASSHAQYCMLPGQTPYSPNQPGITNFKLNTINRTSGNSESTSAVVVVTGLSTQVTPGQTYTISITHSEDATFFPGDRNNLRVWVDYNNNFSFTDPGETVLSKDLESPGTTYTAVFTVPTSIGSGTYTLRATAKMSSDAGHTLPTPCNSPADPLGYHGEMEDYTLVVNIPGYPKSAFAVSSPTVCQSQTLSTSNTSTGAPTPAFSWSASPSAGVTFSPNNQAAQPVITFGNSGNYTITCVASNSIGSNSSSQTVAVSFCAQAPQAAFSVSSNTLCKGYSIAAANSSSGTPAPTYSWSATPSNGVTFSPGSTDPNPQVAFALYGSYTLSCKATNQAGSSTATKQVTVYACVGVEEHDRDKFSVWPNPAQDVLRIRAVDGGEELRVTVINILGEIVQDRIPVSAGDAKVDISSLEEGVYYLRIESAGGSFTGSFVKRN